LSSLENETDAKRRDVRTGELVIERLIQIWYGGGLDLQLLDVGWQIY
jgi:hypothetical protein